MTLRGERPALCFEVSKTETWGAARAEDAQGTPTQSRISQSILVYEDKTRTLNPTSAVTRSTEAGLGLGVDRVDHAGYRGTSLIRKRPPPRTTIGP